MTLGKIILLTIFGLVLLVSSLLVWQYVHAINSKNSGFEIPSINIDVPVVGNINLYTDKDELDALRADKIRNEGFLSSYKSQEGQLISGYQIIYGTYVRFNNNLLSLKARGNDFNYQFELNSNSSITCWPEFQKTSDGGEIDLKNIWFDTRNQNIPLHLEDEIIKKWGEIYASLKEGDTFVIVLDRVYDFNSKNIPIQIAVIGCKND